MANSIENKRKTLKATGMRATSQRALILDVMRQGHMDADEIYRQARVKLPRLSLSTVYRTLRMFKEIGLVEELHFDEAHHHYEVKPRSEHHHLVCLGCGKVIEFVPDPALDKQWREEIKKKNSFDVTGVEIRMSGYCAACQQKRRES